MNGATWLLLAGGGAMTSRIKGRVKLMPGGYLGDDLGFCKILGCHLFPFLWLVANDEPGAVRAAGKIRRAGFRTVRIAHLMANDFDLPTPPNSYWYGRDISKEMNRATLKRGLDILKGNNLRAILTAGHEYRGSIGFANHADEYGWHDELSGRIHDDGHDETIAAYEILGNEVDANRTWLMDNVWRSMEWARGIQAIVRRNLPGVLLTNGSFGNESTSHAPGEPLWVPNLINSADGADMVDIHTERFMTGSIRYVHTEWYDTHFNQSYVKPIHQGEEPGENAPYEENTNNPKPNLGGDVYIGCDDKHYIHTRHALGLTTGQLVSYLNGPGVRAKVEIDSTIFFNRIVKSMDPIPEDVVTWRDERNPSWWIKGKEFIYVGLVEWRQIEMPPHPVAHADFYDIDGKCGEGKGIRLVPPDGWKGGIIRGTFD